MEVTTIGAVAQIVSAIVLVVTAVILYVQIGETRRAKCAVAFKLVYDMLQNEAKREDRGFVLNELSKKRFDTWTPAEKKRAERVCHN